MNKKYFVGVDVGKKQLSKEEKASLREGSEQALKTAGDQYREKSKKRIESEEVKLIHVDGRIIIKIDLDAKDIHRFADGTELIRDRRVKNLNRRETEPVNAWVVSAEDIPKGSEILIHPNSICDANKIFNYAGSGAEQGNSVRYYSIETISAFLFREGEEWKPLKGFATALRVFKPYSGTLVGIEPTQIKNVLYLTSGEMQGKVCDCLKASDYEIIFTGVKGIEERIIRCRHYEGEYHDREELTCINQYLTERVEKGELFLGLSPSDFKKINV